MSPGVVKPPAKPVFDNGEGDHEVMAQVLSKYKKLFKKEKISNLNSLKTSDMLSNLVHFDKKI